MADFYPYLVSSLPMLHPGMKPPFSYGKFLELCRQFVPEPDYRILRGLPMPPVYPGDEKAVGTVRGWVGYDTALRNELVKIRARKIHAEPSAYLRPGAFSSSSAAAAAQAAIGSPSILDTEKILDEARWKALDDLGTGHHFDLDQLITYAYKLLILIRWEEFRNADAAGALEKVLQPSG